MKIYLSKLQKYDKNHGTSIVRELEMIADSCITSPGYSIQFWRDVALYGIDEAIAYVMTGKHGDYEQLKTKFEKVLRRMKL